MWMNEYKFQIEEPFHSLVRDESVDKFVNGSASSVEIQEAQNYEDNNDVDENNLRYKPFQTKFSMFFKGLSRYKGFSRLIIPEKI